MPWNSPATRSTGYLVTAANWNEVANDLAFMAQVAYVEFTADVAISATTVGTANQIVSAGAITYEAVPHVIEFYCARLNSTANPVNVVLRDGTTVLGTIAQLAASNSESGLRYLRQLTPTAASHTYNFAAWMGGATTSTFKAGTGGTAGDTTTYLPGFIRVTRVPT